jgi:hypothetical protein
MTPDKSYNEENSLNKTTIFNKIEKSDKIEIEHQEKFLSLSKEESETNSETIKKSMNNLEEECGEDIDKTRTYLEKIKFLITFSLNKKMNFDFKEILKKIYKKAENEDFQFINGEYTIHGIDENKPTKIGELNKFFEWTNDQKKLEEYLKNWSTSSAEGYKNLKNTEKEKRRKNYNKTQKQIKVILNIFKKAASKKIFIDNTYLKLIK